MNLLKDLNQQQLKVVKHDKGPLLVVAGAGTGKTQAITRRVAYLIEQGKAKPEEILVLTFTDKAANEMEERIDILLPTGVITVGVMTFNAFGDGLIKEYGMDIGLPVLPKLLTKSQQLILLTDHFDELKLKYFAPWSHPTSQLGQLLTYCSTLANELVTPEQYSRYAKKLTVSAKTKEDRAEAQKQAELASFYQTYTRLKRLGGQIDYDDQLGLALELLDSRPNVLRDLHKIYKYILVDEFQDTNRAQLKLLELLAGKNQNLVVVGDDDQSIYRFRGASEANIIEFKQRFKKSKTIVLKRNYRNSQKLLDSAYKLIQHNNPNRLEAKYKFDKRLIGRSGGKAPRLLVEHGQTDLAGRIAGEIRVLIDLGKRPGDIAVLARKRHQFGSLMPALRRTQVPFLLYDFASLFAQPEVAVLLNYLEYLSDPGNSSALYHLLSHELFGADHYALAKLSGEARRMHESLDQVLRFKGSDPIKKRLSQIDQWRKESAGQTVTEGIIAFLRNSGYQRWLEVRAEATPEEIQSAFENLNRWFKSLTEFEAVAIDPSIRGYVLALPALRESGELSAYQEPDLSGDEVALITVHQAKGLEFEHVYILDLNNDDFPASDRGPKNLEIPNELIGHRPSSAKASEGQLAKVAEERRLMYVAMTRAKQELVLTFASDHGGKRLKKPSIFIKEALGAEPKLTSVPKPTLKLPVAAVSTMIKRLVAEKFTKDGYLELTPHQIDDYLSCPYNFRYKYVLAVPEEPSASATYGSLIHLVIQQYYRLRRRGAVKLTTLTKMVDALWDNRGHVSRAHAVARRKQAKRTVTRFFKREEATNLIPLHSETAFSIVVPGTKIRLKGRWDAVFRHPDGSIEVRDYKTAQVEDEGKAEQKTKDSIQLGLYALAWQLKTGNLPDRVTLDFVDTAQIGTAVKTPKQIDALIDKVKLVAEGVRRADFKPSSSHIFCAHGPIARAVR